jgi:hypothetical protein
VRAATGERKADGEQQGEAARPRCEGLTLDFLHRGKAPELNCTVQYLDFKSRVNKNVPYGPVIEGTT